MSNTNAHKPGYKHTPLGWIPEEWNSGFLEEYCSKITDGTHGTPAATDIGYPYLTAIHIKDGAIDYDGCYFLSETDHKDIYNRCNPERGDVLMVNIGAGVAATAYVNVDFEFSLKNVALIKPNRKMLDGRYLEAFQYYIKPRLLKELNGGAQPFLGLGDIRRLPFFCPQLTEQREIAKVINKWDEAIQKIQQVIEQLKQRNKGLIQQLLTGKKRLKGFGGNWVKRSADEIFKSHSKKNNGEEPLLSVTQDRGALPRDMLEGRVTMPDSGTQGYKLVEPGNFIISLRSFQGGLEYSEYRGLVSPAYTVLKPVVPIDEQFYRYYFKSYDFIGHLAVAVIGIRDGKQISFDDFCVLRLPYPSLPEQKAIAEILNKSNIELKLHEQQLTNLQQQKKGLMQKLLSGEVRVNAKN